MKRVPAAASNCETCGAPWMGPGVVIKLHLICKRALHRPIRNAVETAHPSGLGVREAALHLHILGKVASNPAHNLRQIVLVKLVEGLAFRE